MRYKPNQPNNDGEQPQQMMVEGYAIPEHPFSDHTQYLKYVNEYELEKETAAFQEQYRN